MAQPNTVWPNQVWPNQSSTHATLPKKITLTIMVNKSSYVMVQMGSKIK